MIIIQDSKNTQSLEGNKVKLTDTNNRTFEINIDDISDASTYLSDNASVVYDNEVTHLNMSSIITDSEGTILDEESLIDDVKSGKVTSLDIVFEATHSGRNLNNAVYTSESMANDCQSFLFPFNKPLIKNHDSYEEPLGRAVDSSFDKSEFVEDRDAIDVTFRVSSQDAMEKFADGRYKTMSIGAQAKHIKCNVCGKDILKDNVLKFCGHWRGERYADQVATWTMTDMNYSEGSVVNKPADVYAQVKRIKVNKKKGESNMSKPKDGLVDVDNILAQDGNNTEPTPTEPTTDPNIIQDGNTGTEPATPETDNIETLKAELKTAKDELVSLKETHATEIVAKDSEIEVLKAGVIVNDSESSKSKELIIKLAKLNKELLQDNVKLLNPEIKDEELLEKSAKELGEMIDELKSTEPKANTPRVIKPVQDPGAPVIDKNTIIDKDDDKSTSLENEVKTAKDFEDIISKIFRVN